MTKKDLKTWDNEKLLKFYENNVAQEAAERSNVRVKRFQRENNLMFDEILERMTLK